MVRRGRDQLESAFRDAPRVLHPYGSSPGEHQLGLHRDHVVEDQTTIGATGESLTPRAAERPRACVAPLSMVSEGGG